ncbi:hypothetical protein [Tessaracoccus oleiagri]|uniref:HPr Serine kinase C-terminal domain-containing protein n=1 Tax=Tessaracoccus oleiagri TaxID=686624 RepID=A0A1G9JCB6_9ACTN|nr:hypothetical protein [Tessaracoccus oleiagri]SDL34865.1 hypothetical protein SAMN04488242_1154 [Tessaracoccus oleiagri]
MSATTRMHGLTVRSEVPLHQSRLLPTATPADLDITVGAPAHSLTEAPTGSVLLHFEMDRQYYTVVADDHGYLLRFYGTCDVRLDEGLRQASVHALPGTDPAILSVLLGGTVLATVLALRGDPVLHASAVQVGDEALAFVGSSGMGKSTTATLFCAEGARLITDDVLRLDLGGMAPRCFLGATELRLRKSAGTLADAFAVRPGQRTTGDAREALSVSTAEDEALPLRAVIVPLPDKDGRRETTVERPDPMAAFLLLSRFPRLIGWRDADILRRQFQQLGDLVDRVPVFVARMPWGPPFPEGLAASVRRAVGAA